MDEVCAQRDRGDPVWLRMFGAARAPLTFSPGLVHLLAVTRAECARGSGRGGKLGFSAEHRPGVFAGTMCI